MTEIKIYVANLRAYNEGELKGEWFTLPVEWDEIVKNVFDSHELDEFGNPMGDYAIHDYESPFEINEFDSIGHLNEIAEVFETLSDLEIEAACKMYDEGYFTDLTMAEEELGKVVFHSDCKDMSDIAYQYIQERYGDNREYDLFLRNFNYDSYGDELDSSGTYLFLENDTALEYVA